MVFREGIVFKREAWGCFSSWKSFQWQQYLIKILKNSYKKTTFKIRVSLKKIQSDKLVDINIYHG